VSTEKVAARKGRERGGLTEARSTWGYPRRERESTPRIRRECKEGDVPDRFRFGDGGPDSKRPRAPMTHLRDRRAISIKKSLRT
jgi:hypothetical protein